MTKEDWLQLLNFFDDSTNSRYLNIYESKSLREKFVRSLNHGFNKLRSDTAKLLPAHEQVSSIIEKRLKANGAPDEVFIVSASKRIHGATMGLGAACNHIVGLSVGTIIVCIPGVLAYYETGETNRRFILLNHRPPSTTGSA